jgi:HEPN domain-containing protein
MNELVAEWVSKADEDYYMAERALSPGEMPLPSSACFHAQQCAEKYLKAFLTAQLQKFPRIHNLDALLDLCLPFDSTFESFRASLASLDGHAVAARYPGVQITNDMAEQALVAMQTVRAFIRSKLTLT